MRYGNKHENKKDEKRGRTGQRRLREGNMMEKKMKDEGTKGGVGRTRTRRRLRRTRTR